MTTENSPDGNNTPNTICSIQFFLILDNAGKRIYCNYYTDEYKTIESQLDFEKKLCQITDKYMVDKSDLDIINFANFNILCKINSEISFFIGQDENENEILLEKVYNEFETQLFNIIQDSLTREKILNSYDKIIILIDEMINGGLVLNLDNDSLYNRIFAEKLHQKNSGENNDNKNTSNKSFISNWFGFWGSGNK